MLAIESPYPQFFDTDGSPLDGGKLYFGVANQNPETSPITVYWDQSLTQPAAQPIRIANGYAARSGAPAMVYAAGDYSLTVKDRRGRLVFTAPNSADYSLGSSVSAIRPDFASTSDASKGDALIGVKQPLTGSFGRTQHSKNFESVSLLDFIPDNLHAAILNFTSVIDVSSYINAAFSACNGRRLVAPAGLYVHAQTLQVPKGSKLTLEGEFSDYDGNCGTVFSYTGAGVALQLGIDDGNPDATGPARGGSVRNIHFKTATGATAVRFQNTALAEMCGCTTRGFSGKVVDLRANVITTIRDNDIAGIVGTEGVGVGSYGIWCDDQYFGNFVLDIENNHIFQLNHAGRFSEGRSLRVYNNVIENIMPGALGGVWEFSTSGYISVASFELNYYENHRGYVWEGSTFSGAILSLSIKSEDAWGSGDATHVNPGVGNLSRAKVFAQDISGNLFVDAEWNLRGSLVMPSVYPTTNVFDQTTTVIRSQVTGEDYEKELVYQLQPSEMLLQAGDFCAVTGANTTTATGGALVITGPGATPAFWTNMAIPQWQLIPETISGTWALFVPNSAADFDRCSRVISITPIARTRYFAIGFTTKGWSALSVDGVLKYDSGSNVPNWHTEVIKFFIAPSAASFTLKFGTNASNPFYIGEARLFEIGAAEFNEPGTMNSTLTKAVKRLMKRGAY
ncbi:MAG: hypothetical protein RL758_137 [Pseudomonadota bacterium]|jgi:hypothetical protein